VPYEKDPRAKRGRDLLERLQIMAEKKALRPTIAHERAVYRQFQDSLAANSAVREMTDRQKQELTGLLAVMLSTYLEGVNAENEPLIAQAHTSAKNNLEKLIGSSIKGMRINESGLVP
jgi:hypothetical protein